MVSNAKLLAIRLKDIQFITGYKIASTYLRSRMAYTTDSLENICFSYDTKGDFLINKFSRDHYFYSGAFDTFHPLGGTTYVLTRDPYKRLLSGIIQATLHPSQNGPNGAFKKIKGISEEFYETVGFYLNLPSKDLLTSEHVFSTPVLKQQMVEFCSKIVENYLPYTLNDVHCSQYNRELYVYIKHLNTHSYKLVDIDLKPDALSTYFSVKTSVIKQSNKVFTEVLDNTIQNLNTRSRQFKLINEYVETENKYKSKIIDLLHKLDGI